MFKVFLKKTIYFKKASLPDRKRCPDMRPLGHVDVQSIRKQNYLNKFHVATNYILYIFKLTPSMKSKLYDLGLVFV